MRIIALVPAFNEEQKVSRTVKALGQIGILEKIVVVDDGSTDKTKVRAQESGAEVVSLKKNIGKGKALNYALEKVNHFDILLLVDADLGESAAETKTLISTVIEEKADMAIADFPEPEKKGGFGLVKKLARWGIKRCGGMEVREPLSGQRALRRQVLSSVGKLEKGFGVEVALTIDALRKGHKVVELTLPLSHTETGRNIAGFFHRGVQFLDVLRVILKHL